MDNPTFPALPQINPNVVIVDVKGNPISLVPSTLIEDAGSPDNSRMKVDVGQAGFYAGRVFRAALSGVMPVAGPAVNFKFTAPIDFVLWTQQLSLTQGAVQLEIFADATSAGVWTPIDIRGVNRMASRPIPHYVPQCTLSVGGSFTGGTSVDLLMLRAAQNNQNATNAGGEFTARGVAASTFHGRISTLTGGLAVNDAAQYLYQLVWEERP